MAGVSPVAGDSPLRSPSSVYRLFWRWHFFAGLLVAPVLIMLAVTGSLILYEKEIERLLYEEVLVVPKRPAAASAATQASAVLREFPGAAIVRFTLPEQSGAAAEWMIRMPDGAMLTVGIDPADARITGVIDSNLRFSAVVNNLHGEFMLGRFGDYVVEFAACWAVVLLVTGVVLWWPRQKRVAGVLVPRLKANGRRFWRDLHAVPSAWNLPIVAFLLLTGLPWSGFWGENLSQLGALSSSPDLFAPTPNFTAPPGADGATPRKLEHHAQANDLPWTIRQSMLPTGQPAGSDFQPRSTAVVVDGLMRIAAERGIDSPGLRVIYPADEAGVFTLSFVPDTAQAQRTVHVNPADGRVIQDVRWPDYSALGKAVEFGVVVHMGRQFGEANRLLLLASCLLLVATVIFGIVTWWKRRPAGRLAPPPLPESLSLASAAPVMAILGVLFPLAGLSMLVLAAFEWMHARRTRIA